MKTTQNFRIYLLLLFSLLVLSSCARIMTSPRSAVQTGLASWYGEDFHGKLTSSKEIYDMYALTAAHNNLLFNTQVKVTNLNNKKSVLVRINDRGPFVKGRIIDMSYSGAKALDMIEPGVVPVRLEILEHLSPKESSRKYVVQIASFIMIKNATHLKRKLQKKYDNVSITCYKTPENWYYRVRVNARSQSDAEKIRLRLQKDGISSYILEEYS